MGHTCYEYREHGMTYGIVNGLDLRYDSKTGKENIGRGGGNTKKKMEIGFRFSPERAA